MLPQVQLWNYFFIFATILEFNEYFSFYFAFASLVELSFVLKIIYSRRNMAYKLAWIVVILLFPLLGYA